MLGGGAARRRVRVPRGQLRRRLADARRGQAAPAELGRGPARPQQPQSESRAGSGCGTRRRSPARPRAAAPEPREPAAASGAGSAAAQRWRCGGSRRRRDRQRRGERSRVHATADRPGQRRRVVAERAADPELRGSRAGFANEKFEAEFRERAQSRLGRPGEGGAGEPAQRHPARDQTARLRPWRRRARASRLPGDGRMVARGARGAAHTRRRQPRRTSRSRERRGGRCRERRAPRRGRRAAARSAVAEGLRAIPARAQRAASERRDSTSRGWSAIPGSGPREPAGGARTAEH